MQLSKGNFFLVHLFIERILNKKYTYQLHSHLHGMNQKHVASQFIHTSSALLNRNEAFM